MKRIYATLLFAGAMTALGTSSAEARTWPGLVAQAVNAGQQTCISSYFAGAKSNCSGYLIVDVPMDVDNAGDHGAQFCAKGSSVCGEAVRLREAAGGQKS